MPALRRLRVSRLPAWVVLGLALTTTPSATAQDFDPNGRRRKPPATRPAGAPRKVAPKATGAPPESGAAAPTTQAALIERYTKVVLSQAGSPFPLQRLAQLYREKDGNLAALVREFENRVAQEDPLRYAATVTLAGIYKLDGRPEEAIKTYEKAFVQNANDPIALIALARLLQDRGDQPGARARYEQALALQTVVADKEQTLRTLMSLALDAKDWNGAKAFHQSLVKLHSSSLFVRGDLGRELLARGEYERAESEFIELVSAARGDNRTLSPALKDLGRAQAKAHKNAEAIATLGRALAVAGQEAAVRAEIYETITDIYREDQKLPTWIAQLEAEHPADFSRLALLGSLYEEVGDAVHALATYRKALATNPRHIDLRLKMIRLLESQGELDKAIVEYDGLIRSAPNNPAFVFEEAEALLQRGDRARALKLLTELEARAASAEDVLARLADFYARIGEGQKSLKVLTRLTEVGQGDPSHLVDLGDHYFQEGNTTLALQTWKRILTTVSPKARALSALGEVYLDHDMTNEALAALREALQLEPQSIAYKRQLAQALERARNFDHARTVWVDLGAVARAAGDKALARESRSRIVTLWGLERLLDAQIRPLSASFDSSPPDMEAGRTLAEVQIHLRRFGGAEGTLRKILLLAPGDIDSYLSLERVLVQENRLAEAISVLEKLVAVEPKKARELYQRMAQYALQLYKDKDAILYAARAVELNPEDAEGHRRLGELYRSRQDIDHAIAEFRAAIAKNERLYVVYFELADLLLSKGQVDDADRLFRRVIRGAPDDELVARAARLAMQIHLGRGTLESLEQDLLPISIGNPQKPIYRRLLVDLYGHLTFGLVERVRHGTKSEADEARSALVRIGTRAVKPLLDALTDTDPGQQRIAIDVLGYVKNKNAAPSLFSFATGDADVQLRVRAMTACGALRDTGLIPKYDRLLFPPEDSGDAPQRSAPSNDAIAAAATWGLVRMDDRRTLPLLRRLAQHGTPQPRALAIYGLGHARDASSTGNIAEMARAFDNANVVRAAAAYALGALGAKTELPLLIALAETGDVLTRQMALLALGRLSASGNGMPLASATQAMTNAIFDGQPGENDRAAASTEALVHAGLAALVAVTGVPDGPSEHDLLGGPDDILTATWILEQLVPRDVDANARAKALVRFAEPLTRAAVLALETSHDRARSVLSAFAGAGSFEPFVHRAGELQIPKTDGVVSDIARAIEPSVIGLTRHPDPKVREKAILFLARSPSEEASSALALAIDDPTEDVQRVALSATGAHPNPRAIAAVRNVAKTNKKWALRVLAVQGMGRLGQSGGGAAAENLLSEVALGDPYALVREASLVALGSFDSEGAKRLARQIEQQDPEPRVRETARAVANGASPPSRTETP